MEHINQAKSWVFEKIKRNDETLPRRIKKKSQKTQINNITNEKSRN